jgi:hypothetical protein
MLLILTGYFVVVAGLRVATSADLLPEGLQRKTEAQLNNPFGLLFGGRPDTATAVYAITKRPLLGYGTTNVNPEILLFYRELNASVLSNLIRPDAAAAIAYTREWSLGTPSHSHLFGAWVDAGVLAALCWLFYLWIAIYVLQRSFFWRHPFQPLFVFVSLLILWDTLFSPGPHRMDVAIRFTVLMLAVQIFSQFDSVRGGRQGIVGFVGRGIATSQPLHSRHSERLI